MCKKMSKCKYPSCLQILHSSSTLFHHRAFFRGRVYIIRLRFDIYSSHHLSFGHTSPQLVDHGIHELAQKMNMMIVLISPIFIIYHCLFIYPTFHWCLVFWKNICIKIHMSVFCALICPETFANMFTQQCLENMS